VSGKSVEASGKSVGASGKSVRLPGLSYKRQAKKNIDYYKKPNAQQQLHVT